MERPYEDDDPYAWHLRLPFSDEGGKKFFNSEHWWKDGTDRSCPLAVTYEVLRRHPEMRDFHLTNRVFGAESRGDPSRIGEGQNPSKGAPDPKAPGNGGPIAYCLNLIGLKTWKNLCSNERDLFAGVLRERHAGKGRDFRPNVYDITNQSIDFDHVKNRNVLLLELKDLQEPYKSEAEAARVFEIQRLAAEHHQAGRVIIAFDRSFASIDTAADALRRCFEYHWCKPETLGRTRPDWLDIIEAFEQDERALTNCTKRDPQKFKAFRGIFEGFEFKEFA